MKNQEKITLEAVGEFPFAFWIEKAVPAEDEGELIIEGIASTTNVDHDKERMSENALRAMEAAINENGVPLRVEHQQEELSVIGRVFKAWVDDRNQLHIRARLDKNHPVGPILHQSMKSGTKMGLSVGGLVKRAVKEFVESVGGTVKTFYDVALKEVSVTPRPSNFDSWLIAKSIAKDDAEAQEYSNNVSLRREFLLENSQLDYLQSFAKSVPDKAWHKVEVPNKINKNNKDMKKEEDKKEDETEKATDEDETEKSVSRSEFTALSKGFKAMEQLMAKGFNTLGTLISKAMDGDAKDDTNPDKAKPDDESPAAKAMDSDAEDQANPGKKKPEDESPTAKSEADGTDVEGEREKSASEDEDEEEKTKTAKKEDKDETYDMETLQRSIKSLEKTQARLAKIGKASTKKTEEDKEKEETEKTAEEEDETEKSEEDEEEKKTTKKSHPLDVYVVTLAKTMEAMTQVMEKQGKRYLGFEKSFIESPEIQTTLAKLMKVPGFKKSVAMGIPYMVTKDGKRMPLIAVPEQVQKSQDDQPKDFRARYKQQYSSVSEGTNE